MRSSVAVFALGVALAGCSATEKLEAVRYEIVVADGSPYLDLTIGGAKGRFLLDTGANTSGVDRAWLDAARITSASAGVSTIGGTTGVLTVATAVLPRFDIGHGFFERPVFSVQDFARFARPGGEPQAGLLGTDFLNSYAVTFDLHGEKAAFALREEREWRPGDVNVPLEYPFNMPAARVELAGLVLPCRLDTGAAYMEREPLLDVNQAVVAALEARGVKRVDRGTMRLAGRGGFERCQLLDAADAHAPLGLRVGPAAILGVRLVVHKGGTLAANEPLALASATLLARLGVFTIDPFERRLVLHRGP